MQFRLRWKPFRQLDIQLPGLAVLAGQKLFGLGAALDDPLFGCVPNNALAAAQSDVRKQAHTGRAVADFNVRSRKLAGFHLVEEVTHVVLMGVVHRFHLDGFHAVDLLLPDAPLFRMAFEAPAVDKQGPLGGV